MAEKDNRRTSMAIIVDQIASQRGLKKPYEFLRKINGEREVVLTREMVDKALDAIEDNVRSNMNKDEENIFKKFMGDTGPYSTEIVEAANELDRVLGIVMETSKEKQDKVIRELTTERIYDPGGSYGR